MSAPAAAADPHAKKEHQDPNPKTTILRPLMILVSIGLLIWAVTGGSSSNTTGTISTNGNTTIIVKDLLRYTETATVTISQSTTFNYTGTDHFYTCSNGRARVTTEKNTTGILNGCEFEDRDVSSLDDTRIWRIEPLSGTVTITLTKKN